MECPRVLGLEFVSERRRNVLERERRNEDRERDRRCVVRVSLLRECTVACIYTCMCL